MRNTFLERVMALRAEEQLAGAHREPGEEASHDTAAVAQQHESMRKLKTHELSKVVRLERAGLSHKDIARALGVAKSTVARALERARLAGVEP